MEKKKVKGIIISGFPGVGKSTAAGPLKDIYDCESRYYSHPIDPRTGFSKEKDPDWVTKYVDSIEQMACYCGYSTVLISTHKEVLDELHKREIPFVICVPYNYLRNEYMKRYIRRGDCAEFIKTVFDHWEEWLDEIGSDPAPKIYLDENENLADIIPRY